MVRAVTAPGPDDAAAAGRAGAGGLRVERGVEDVSRRAHRRRVGADQGGLAAGDGGRRRGTGRAAGLDGVAAERRGQGVAQAGRGAADIGGEVAGPRRVVAQHAVERAAATARTKVGSPPRGRGCRGRRRPRGPPPRGGWSAGRTGSGRSSPARRPTASRGQVGGLAVEARIRRRRRGCPARARPAGRAAAATRRSRRSPRRTPRRGPGRRRRGPCGSAGAS